MPEWIDALLRPERIAVLAVVILFVETALVLMFARTPARRGIFYNAVSGVALLLAMRTALVSPGNTLAMLAWLGLGFAAHLADLILRLRRGA